MIRQINLASDILLSSGDLDEPVDQHRTRNSLVPAKFTRFPNGEFKTEILSSVRNTDIYIVQDVANRYPLQFQKNEPAQTLSVNDHLFCLLMTVDAALQAGALQVTVILPTFPYSRQHKKKGRESLSAARVGQMLEYFGVTRLITLDIHSKEIENCFNHLRLENLHGAYQILKMLATVTDLKDENLMVVAPDTGAVERSKFYASILGTSAGHAVQGAGLLPRGAERGAGQHHRHEAPGLREGQDRVPQRRHAGHGGNADQGHARPEGGRRAAEHLRGEPAVLHHAESVESFQKAYEEGLFTPRHRDQRRVPRRFAAGHGNGTSARTSRTSSPAPSTGCTTTGVSARSWMIAA